jgi:HSP20 family molecular chaperone IbpA
MPLFPRFHYPETPSGYSAFPTDILRMFTEDFDVPSSSPTGRRAFSPNFDVHETDHEYVLEGELPGLSDKKNVSIEFTDDKTILIHGKIDRAVKGWRDDQGNIKTIEQGEEQKKIEGSKEEKEKEKEKEKRPKYWVSERSVGEFSRSFSFPGHVDIDRVKASLDHGILKVVVPKLEKKAGRRIEVA